MKRKIRIGLDFDGVVAYNPFRVVRSPISFFKREILGIKKLRFFVPQAKWERIFWIIIHESSVFPARGTGLLKELATRDDVEFYLITARFSFLQPSLYRWLDRYGLRKVFKEVHMNLHDEQPHVHKLQTINKLKLDYFVEDNLDIVSYLSGKTQTKIFWIYNLSDRKVPYPNKYPVLEESLRAIRL